MNDGLVGETSSEAFGILLHIRRMDIILQRDENMFPKHSFHPALVSETSRAITAYQQCQT
jgi:hypothetical protein